MKDVNKSIYNMKFTSSLPDDIFESRNKPKSIYKHVEQLSINNIWKFYMEEVF